MTFRHRGRLAHLLTAVFLCLMLPCIGPAPLAGQAPQTPGGADAKTSPAEAAPQDGDREKAEPLEAKGPRVTWYLLSHEAEKIGYEVRALYEVTGQGNVAHRLVTHRFLKDAPEAGRAGFLQKSTMDMDADWTALAFTTSLKPPRGERTVVEGRVADGKLTVTATCGPERLSSTAPVEGRPTFSGAFVEWLAGQEPAEGKTFIRRTIDEKHGVVGTVPSAARILQKARLEVAPGKTEDGFVVVEQNGAQATAHLLHAGGLLFRSEGQNHNLAAQEVSPLVGAKLEVTEAVTRWENHIPGKMDSVLSSESFGYTLKLPAYPYLATSMEDGQFLATESITAGDGYLIIVRPVPNVEEEAVARLYADWGRSMGPLSDVVEGQTTVDKLPARLYTGRGAIGGRPCSFRLATVVRGHVGYLLAHLRVFPPSASDAEAFRTFLDGVSWSKIFGRERGHWEGPQYVSDSYGYRLQLLGPLWRLPEQREGVATSVEAVREDRSAMMAVMLEEPGATTTLDQAATAYEARIKAGVPGAADLKREATRLDGQAAVLLTYQAKAIDGEPTESRHVMALRGERLYILTFVGKLSTLEPSVKHFEQAVASFRFAAPPEAPQGSE